MPESHGKRRKLRSSDEQSKNTALLYHFDSSNKLLYGEGRISIDYDSEASADNQYKHFGEASWASSDMPIPSSEMRSRSVDLPRRRRKTIMDPLNDAIYETFHKRMKKDERSRTLTDRGRMYFEMDNVKSQLELLQQHDWNKHLPQLTVIKDRSDIDELLWKRDATIRELEAALAKFANWESRTARLAAEVKHSEMRRTSGHPMYEDDADDDADDDDEAILNIPLEDLKKERLRSRIREHGRPFFLSLGNGYKIRYNPYLLPTAVVERDAD